MGLLTDGRVYVFLMLRSRLSGCGEEGGQPTDWHLHYYVARYCDCLTGEDENKVPSVLQCFAYALQCAKRHQRSGPEAASWLKRLADVVRSGQEQAGCEVSCDLCGCQVMAPPAGTTRAVCRPRHQTDHSAPPPPPASGGNQGSSELDVEQSMDARLSLSMPLGLLVRLHMHAVIATCPGAKDAPST